MGKVEDTIKELIDYRYGSIPKFAEEAGVPAPTIYYVLKKGISGSSIDTVLPIIAQLGLDANWILQNRVVEMSSNENEYVDTPMYGSIAAGTPIEMLEAEDYIPIPQKLSEQYPKAFLLKVEGESMNKALPNRSYALVDPSRKEPIHDKHAYAVCVNGHEATIKRVKQLNNGFELIPDSTDPTYEIQTFNYNEEGTEEITIIGEIVWYTIPFDFEI